MGINYRYINTPSKCVNEELFLPETAIVTEKCVCGSGYWPGKWQHESEIFTDEFRDWLSSFDCKILKAEAFRVFPHTSLAWHNDTNDNPLSDDLDLNLTTKINFMWGDLKNCFMEYGVVTDPLGVKIIKNPRGRRAYVYDPEKMSIVEQFSLERPILINRGPTHRVSNHSDKDWVCLSCIIQSTKTGEPLLFSDALSIFRSVYV